MESLEYWISNDLESMVEEFSDWQTTKANREYFGR